MEGTTEFTVEGGGYENGKIELFSHPNTYLKEGPVLSEFQRKLTQLMQLY